MEKLVTDGRRVRILPGVKLLKGQKVGVDEFTYVFQTLNLVKDGCTSSNSLTDFQKQEIYLLVFSVFEDEILKPIDLSLGTKFYDRGINQYKFGREIGTGAGLIAIGGNNDTIMFRLTGHGTQISSFGWQHFLFKKFNELKGHFTRIDLAFDDFEGKIYPVRKMAEMAETGIFKKSFSQPKFNQAGEWLSNDPNNKGLTFYVGDRSSKLARIYEKGKQLGDANSSWVRFEIELHSSIYVLSLDMLIHPTNYFCALYPCCEWIEWAGDLNSLIKKDKVGLNSLEQIGNWLRTQTGHYLNQLRPILGDELLLDWICRKGDPVEVIKALELLSPAALAELKNGILAK